MGPRPATSTLSLEICDGNELIEAAVRDSVRIGVEQCVHQRPLDRVLRPDVCCAVVKPKT
jgi:hypothetical protein